jgi:hypothetical protein
LKFARDLLYCTYGEKSSAATLAERTVPKLEPQEKPCEVSNRCGKESAHQLVLRIEAPSGTKTYYVQIAHGKREMLAMMLFFDASEYWGMLVASTVTRLIGFAPAGYAPILTQTRSKRGDIYPDAGGCPLQVHSSYIAPTRMRGDSMNLTFL